MQPKLYNIAEHPDDAGAGVWIAVWAHGDDEALSFAYGATGSETLQVVGRPWDFLGEPSHIPSREQRPEILRQIGWHQGDEWYCRTCDQAPMGLEQFAVCPECEECRECAAEEGDPEYQCQCIHGERQDESCVPKL